jgi:hypothetical protein
MNQFRAADAFEFVDAVRECGFDKEIAERNARDLAKRMAAIEASGKPVPSYLLAAYRGYEYVVSGPFSVVTLDEAKEIK